MKKAPLLLSAITLASFGCPSRSLAAAPPDPAETICGAFQGSATDEDGDIRDTFQVGDLTVTRLTLGPASSAKDPDNRRGEKFGLGDRPVNDAQAAAEWDRRARAVGRHRTFDPPCIHPNVRAATALANYSGWFGTAATGKKYDSATTDYVAPSNYYLSGCTNESMTDWAGILGTATPVTLIQAGVYDTQYNQPEHHAAFYEIVGGPLNTSAVVDMSHFTVDFVPAHSYTFSVAYDAGSSQLVFTVLDNTTGFSETDVVTSSNAAQYVRSKGYFISERLDYAVGGVDHYSAYMKHTVAQFSNSAMHIQGETDARLVIQRPADVFMQDAGVTLGDASTPLGSSNSSFSTQWHACQG